jgi:hypothetical protein
VCYLCISASSQPTVYKLVIKATLDTSGGGIFHRKIGESLLCVDHFGHLLKPLWQVHMNKCITWYDRLDLLCRLDGLFLDQLGQLGRLCLAGG